MITPTDSFFESPITNPRYLNKNYPEFYEYLIKTYPSDISISEKLYWWRNNIDTYPLCPVCNNRLKFYSISKGYAQFCSCKCSNSSNSKKEQIKRTCLDRYGVENPRQSKIVKDKFKQTCLDRYGVENPFESTEIQHKIKQTNIERYGVEYTGQSESIKIKIKDTLRQRYNVNSSLELPQTKQNLDQTRKEIALKKYSEFIDVVPGEYIIKCPHPGCTLCEEKQYRIPSSVFFDRRRDRTEPCTHILPVRDKTWGSGIEKTVRSILDKYNISYICNDRSIIYPKELDIYIPSKNIAIECNGVYSHCSRMKPSTYHVKKTLECWEQGVQLIHLWEDQIKNTPDIIESILCAKLGICSNRIYARNCIIKHVPTKICHQFLNDNHIQGKTNSSIKLGLYYNDELVSIMVFGKKRGLSGNNKRIDGEWELIRFCNKLNAIVPGAASKLLKYFIKNYHPTYIYSFSSNDISTGNLYKTLGFVSDEKIDQSYWWVKNGTLERFHRSEFNKERIVNYYKWRDVNDSSWTEEEEVYKHGYFKIVDSGMKKWYLFIEKINSF